MWYKRLSWVVFVVLLVSVLILGSFGCARPAPTPSPAPKPTPAASPAPSPKPAPAPTPAPKPSPAPSPTPKPTPKPAAPATPAVEIPPGAKPIKITYLGGMPLKTLITDGQERFKKLVEERSKGLITVELYPAGQLYLHHEIPKAIEAGAASMAVGDPTQWSGTAPAVNAIYVQCGFDTLKQAVRFCDGPYFDIVDGELNRTKTKLVGWTFYGGATGVIAKDPIRTVADLSGKKLRVMGEIIALYWKELGVSVAVIASAETYTALQRGTIDAAFSGVETFVSRKWMEAAKHVLLPPNYGAFQRNIFVVVWNIDKWNALPPWAQDLVTKCVREVYEWQLAEADKLDKANIETLEKNKVTIYCIPEAEWPEWAKRAKSSWDYLAKQDKEHGGAIVRAAELAKAAK